MNRSTGVAAGSCAARSRRSSRALFALLCMLVWVLSSAHEGAAFAQGAPPPATTAKPAVAPKPPAGSKATTLAPEKLPKPKGDKKDDEKIEPGGGDNCVGDQTAEKNKEKEKANARLGPEVEALKNRSLRARRLESARSETDVPGKRVEALQKMAEYLRHSCDHVEEAQKAAGSDTEKTKIVGEMKVICSTFCHDEVPIDFCAFSDPVAANAAVLADWASAGAMIAYLQPRLDAFAPIVKPAPPPGGKEGGKTGEDRQREAAKAVRELGISPAGPVGEAATAALDALQVGLAALAKVIEDRAKREAIGWFLQTVADDLCWRDPALTAAPPAAPAASELPNHGLNPQTEAQKRATEMALRRELTTYWFPTLCNLAGSNNDLSQYGAGAKLLETLRSALAKDVRSWPGVASGLGLGAAFWTSIGEHSNLLECAPGGTLADSVSCKALGELRRAGAAFMEEILAGQSATIALSTLSTRIDAANHKTASELHSEGFQVSACAAAIPLYFDQHQGSITGAMDRAEKTESLLVAALASTPACWTIVGKGLVKSECELLRTTRIEPAGGPLPGCGKDKFVPALGTTKSLERLSTVLRLSGKLTGGARGMEGQWDKLNKALEAYEQVVHDTANAPGAAPPSPALEPGKISAADATVLKDLLEEQARLLQKGKVVRHLQAAVAVARAAVDLGGVTLDAFAGIVDPALLPGLPKVAASAITIGTKVAEARLVVTEISGGLGVVDGVIHEDWGAAIAQTLGTLRFRVKALCPPDDPICQDKVARLTGFIVAVISEKDPERLAQTLDSLADPVGGWRSKSKKGMVSVSLAAFPGFAGGMEWRTGQYGVVRENFKRTYVAAPTLVMPVGLDIVAGNSCGWPAPFGVFISAIDPAAFLQYDASKQGRVPAPKLTTVLSPGLWLRLGIGGTPFSINPYVVFRPGLRAWNAGVSTPAADAMQLGLSLSVDVTLLSFYSQARK